MQKDFCISSNKLRLLALALVAAVALYAAACKEDPRVKLQRGVDFAKEQLLLAGSDPALTEALDKAEAEGNVVNYITGRVAVDAPEMPIFLADQQPKEWSVVIRHGTYLREYYIDGYGEDLTKPLISTALSIKAAAPAPAEEKKE